MLLSHCFWLDARGGDGTFARIDELEYDEALIVEFRDTEELDNRDAIGLL